VLVYLLLSACSIVERELPIAAVEGRVAHPPHFAWVDLQRRVDTLGLSVEAIDSAKHLVRFDWVHLGEDWSRYIECRLLPQRPPVAYLRPTIQLFPAAQETIIRISAEIRADPAEHGCSTTGHYEADLLERVLQLMRWG
jgi:hypothetical protein